MRLTIRLAPVLVPFFFSFFHPQISPVWVLKKLRSQFWFDFYEPKPKPLILTLQTRYLPTTGLNLAIRGQSHYMMSHLLKVQNFQDNYSKRKVVRKSEKYVAWSYLERQMSEWTQPWWWAHTLGNKVASLEVIMMTDRVCGIIRVLIRVLSGMLTIVIDNMNIQ